MERISWAGSQANTIDEDLIEEYYQGVNQEVINFGNRLYAILLSCTEEDLSTSVRVWQTATGSRQCAC